MAIYLDNNSYTFLAPDVEEEVREFLAHPLGNPSSTHHLGQKARAKIVKATQVVSSFLGVKPEEILYTSGATEALNMLIFGLGAQGHVVASALEHAAVLQPLERLKQVTLVYPEEGQGSVSCEQIEAALREDTKLLVLMWVNNETGIKNSIAEIARLAEQRGILLVVDGVALLGKELFEIPSGVSALCFSGGKIHALSGSGCAFIRKGVKVPSLLLGGTQQRGRRGGTENLLGILSFAKAIESARNSLPEASYRMEKLRNRFEEAIVEAIPEAYIHGKNEARVVNVSNIAFPHIDGETLLIRLDLAGLCASLGSACATGGIEPSHVLLNMGVAPSQALSSVRFSLSRFTTEEEIERALSIVIREARAIRK